MKHRLHPKETEIFSSVMGEFTSGPYCDTLSSTCGSFEDMIHCSVEFLVGIMEVGLTESRTNNATLKMPTAMCSLFGD